MFLEINFYVKIAHEEESQISKNVSATRDRRESSEEDGPRESNLPIPSLTWNPNHCNNKTTRNLTSYDTIAIDNLRPFDIRDEIVVGGAMESIGFYPMTWR